MSGSSKARIAVVGDAELLEAVVDAVGANFDVIDGRRTGSSRDVVAVVCAAGATTEVVRSRDVPLVVVVDRPAGPDVRRAFAGGASGVLHRARLGETLAAGLGAVRVGLQVAAVSPFGPGAAPVLTQREKQIMGMVVLGMSNPEIATQLVIAETTVKKHLATVFSKLGVRGRNEATAAILDPERGYGTGILRITEDPDG